jgi:hypothetical protein
MTESCGGCKHFTMSSNIGDNARLPAGYGRCLQSVVYRFKSPNAACQFNPSRFVAAPEPFTLKPLA